MGIGQTLRSQTRHAFTGLQNTIKLMSGKRFTAPYHTDYRVVTDSKVFTASLWEWPNRVPMCCLSRR